MNAFEEFKKAKEALLTERNELRSRIRDIDAALSGDSPRAERPVRKSGRPVGSGPGNGFVTIENRILEALKDGPLYTGQLSERLGRTTVQYAFQLRMLVRAGKVTRLGHGHYCLAGDK